MPPAAAVLLSLFPNSDPEPKALVVGVLAGLDVGVELGFPNRLDAGLLAPPPPPPKSPPAIEAGCELPPPNSPPAGPPPVVGVPEPDAAFVVAPPKGAGFCSAGLLPNILPLVPDEGAPVAVVLLLLLLLLLPPNEKPAEPLVWPNGLLEGVDVVVPKRELVAGAVDVGALAAWPAELLPPNVNDIVGWLPPQSSSGMQMLWSSLVGQVSFILALLAQQYCLLLQTHGGSETGVSCECCWQSCVRGNGRNQ